MKTMSLIVLLGLSANVIAADAPRTAISSRKTATVQTAQPNGGYWCRTSDGRWAWVAPKTESTKTGAANTQKTSDGPVRVYSYYRPPVVVSYPNDDEPEIVNGVNWYLNGRSYFSD